MKGNFMTSTFMKTFSRANIDVTWPPQIGEIDNYISSTYTGCLSWRVTSVSDDGLTLSYTSTWSSIEELLEAALTDDTILNNTSQITEYCDNNNIIVTYTII
jgi:hypothetical protein